MIVAADSEQQRCRCPLEKQVVVQGGNVPHLVSTAVSSFLLDDLFLDGLLLDGLLLGNHLGRVGLNRLHREGQSADAR
jgi:hypothetical protein